MLWCLALADSASMGGPILQAFWVQGLVERPVFPIPAWDLFQDSASYLFLGSPHPDQSSANSSLPCCPQAPAAHLLIPDLSNISASLCTVLASQSHCHCGICLFS